MDYGSVHDFFTNVFQPNGTHLTPFSRCWVLSTRWVTGTIQSNASHSILLGFCGPSTSGLSQKKVISAKREILLTTTLKKLF